MRMSSAEGKFHKAGGPMAGSGDQSTSMPPTGILLLAVPAVAEPAGLEKIHIVTKGLE